MNNCKLHFGMISLTLVSLACLGQAADGLSQPDDPTNLQGYLQYAALNNAGLKAAFERWKAALERVPQARSLPDPRFTYGYFIREVETRVGPQKQKVGISQVFPWFGKIQARADVAAASAEVAMKQYQARKLRLFFEVKEAFYEYTYLASAIDIAKENLELVRRIEEIARIKYTAATARHPDVIRAQVELAKLDDRLRALEELRKPAVGRLNAVLNRHSLEMLPWPEREQFRVVKIDEQSIREILGKRNPELQALDSELQSARSMADVAKKTRYPDVGVGVDWIDTDRALAQGVRDSGKDPVMLMFSLNLPIWSSSYTAAELEARANVRRFAHQRDDMENRLLARVERLFYDLRDSERKMKLYRDILLPKAGELLGTSQTAYEAGTIDFLSLIDAQQTLLEFRLHYERALTNNQQGLAELEMLVGVDLPGVEPAPQPQ